MVPRAAAEAPMAHGAAAESHLRALTQVQAALLSHTDLAAATAAFVREIALQLSLARVSLGLCRGLNVELMACSAGPLPTAHSALAQQLQAAMAEALDQRCSLCLPALRAATQPRITLALQALLRAEPGSVACVPVQAGLGHSSSVVGVLCVQRQAGGVFTSAELAGLEQLALLAAPVLKLMALNERPWHRRARDSVNAAVQALRDDSRHGLRYGTLAAGLVAAALLFVPADTRIGGHARLEGAVQRVLVAPADGFLGKVHVRPGDVVRAGQLLAELAEQDLQVERARWESQLAQHENAYSAAHAGANRTQLVINQARAAEAQAQLDLVNARLARTHITAPFDAVVIKGDLSQQLGAPLSQGTELMTLAPQHAFRVMVEVDERDIGAVRVGQTGSVALSALPWRTQAIRVTRITPMAAVVDGRNVYEVEAALHAPAGSDSAADLRAGLQGSAQIATGRAPLLWNASRRLVQALRLLWWEWLG